MKVCRLPATFSSNTLPSLESRRNSAAIFRSDFRGVELSDRRTQVVGALPGCMPQREDHPTKRGYTSPPLWSSLGVELDGSRSPGHTPRLTASHTAVCWQTPSGQCTGLKIVWLEPGSLALQSGTGEIRGVSTTMWPTSGHCRCGCPAWRRCHPHCHTDCGQKVAKRMETVRSKLRSVNTSGVEVPVNTLPSKQQPRQ